MLRKNCKNKTVARYLSPFSQKSKYMYFLTTCVVSFIVSSYAKTTSMSWYSSKTLFRETTRQVNLSLEIFPILTLSLKQLCSYFLVSV